jgi:ADP-glucose pyrophosphorylase
VAGPNAARYRRTSSCAGAGSVETFVPSHEPVALFDLLEETVVRGGTDFGHHVLPHAASSGARVFAYDFSRNRVPGLKPYEEAAYWRDVGTMQALGEARRDLEGPRPRLDPDNPDWPLQPAARNRAAA